MATTEGEGDPSVDEKRPGAVDFMRSPPQTNLSAIFPSAPHTLRKKNTNAIDPSNCRRVFPCRPGKNLPYPGRVSQRISSENITEEMWIDVKEYITPCALKWTLAWLWTLIEQGIYDDTLIIFFSDHGDFTNVSAPEKTHTLQDCLLHVPLIIKPPQPLKPNPATAASY